MKLLFWGQGKQRLKQAMCNHQYATMLRWHWTHGPNGNTPAFVEAEYECDNCGKIVYLHQQGKEAHEWAKCMGNHLEA